MIFFKLLKTPDLRSKCYPANLLLLLESVVSVPWLNSMVATSMTSTGNNCPPLYVWEVWGFIVSKLPFRFFPGVGANP